MSPNNIVAYKRYFVLILQNIFCKILIGYGDIMKKIIGFSSVIFIISLTCFITIKEKNKNNKITLQDTSSTGLISVMLQNDEGNYIKTERTTWPTAEEGYEFNSELSRCENGSELSWENNKVRIKTSTSDKCYVYFDIKKPLEITDIQVDTSEPYIAKLTIIAKGGTGDYTFSIEENSCVYDCGSCNLDFSANKNIIVLRNLDFCRTYSFKVKVTDSNGDIAFKDATGVSVEVGSHTSYSCGKC